MKAEFTDFGKVSNWVDGKVENYTFSAKLFDNGSEFGIDCGRVSKLSIVNENDKYVCNYDRGWDVRPSKKDIEYYNAVMELLENSPKRFSE